jgi:hypothetical protein
MVPYPVYTALIPDNSPLPYAVVMLLGSNLEYTVGNIYIETAQFQVSVWHTTLAGAESLSQTVDFAFNRKYFASNVIECDKTSYVIPPVEVADQIITYGAILNYSVLYQRYVTTG